MTASVLRRMLGLSAVALLLLPATALAAARMTAPSHAAVGSRITVSANGLKPGRYTLELVVEVLPGGASPTFCLARVGAAKRAQGGKVTISGKLPARLGCHMGEGILEGFVPARPGKYTLSLGVLLPPAGFSETGSFVKHSIRLVSGLAAADQDPRVTLPAGFVRGTRSARFANCGC
jgi:hypothetical protein